MNLTTLVPAIVVTILGETLLPQVTLFELVAGTPLLWEEQWGGLSKRGSVMIFLTVPM